MGIYRLSLSSDTWITSESLSGNGGADHVLNIAAKYVINDDKKYLSRILGRADFSSNSDIMKKINSGIVPNPVTDSTVTAKLIMFDCLHSEPQAYSFNTNVFRVTSDWDEGRGIGFNEGNDLLMTGFANYMYSRPNTFWSTSGGDYVVNTTSAAQTFDYGNENLDVDITEMVKGWISNTYPNYGFIVKMSDQDEIRTGSSTSSLNTYRKSFFSRETDFLKWPRIEFLWNDQIKDNRNSFKIGSSGCLYFYNIVNGAFWDLDSTNRFPGYVVIEGATSVNSNAWSSISSSLLSLTALRAKKGVYKITIPELPYSLYSTYTKFRDKWVLTSSISSVITGYSQSFNVSSIFDNTFDYIENSKIIVSTNINSEYQKGTKF